MVLIFIKAMFGEVLLTIDIQYNYITGRHIFIKSSTLSSSGVHTRFRVGGTNVSYINDNGDYVKGSSDLKFKNTFIKNQL